MTMLRTKSLLCSTLVFCFFVVDNASRILKAADDNETPTMHVSRCEDFEVNGRGDNDAWKKIEWTALHLREGDGEGYESRVKMLYSEKGLYVLMDGGDRKLTATIQKDFENLWEEDVFEVFLWPDEKFPLYFEYEISPLGHELPILVPNLNGQFFGWLPWHYETRRIQKAISIRGGEQQSGAKIQGWTAEIFMPYSILHPLTNVPPQKGSHWRANFYRMDYDDQPPVRSWDWSRVGPSFHEYEKFGTLIFD